MNSCFYLLFFVTRKLKQILLLKQSDMFKKQTLINLYNPNNQHFVKKLRLCADNELASFYILPKECKIYVSFIFCLKHIVPNILGTIWASWLLLIEFSI